MNRHNAFYYAGPAVSLNLDQDIIDEGRLIFSAAKAEKESLFDKQFWLGRMMDWVMKDPSFKVDLFHFVDVLPMLSTTDQVAKHIKEYLLKSDREIPLIMNTALKAASFSLAQGIAAKAIKKNVSDMAQRFIAGIDIKSARDTLQKLAAQGFCFTIDLLGEKTLSEREADIYLERYLKLISALPDALKGISKDDNPPNVSVKISALSCNLFEQDPDFSVRDLKRRLIPLLKLAKETGVFINFDVESFQSHEICYALLKDIALSDEFKAWPHLGIVVQAYLKNSLALTKDLLELASTRKTPITIRLVKGAYWDYEVINAEQHSHHQPVFSVKSETDHNYELISKLLLDNVKLIRPAFASHNIRSLAHAITYAKTNNIDTKAYEIQMLYGMAEAERRAFLSRGHTVRIYMPLGEMLPGMSYLVRRLLENTSQMGFLKMSHHDHKDETALLQKPVVDEQKPATQNTQEFINASTLDFVEKPARNRFAQAITQVRKSLPITIPVVVEGKIEHGSQEMVRFCPSDTSLKIASCKLATTSHAEQAIKACMKANQPLRSLTILERAQHLRKLADILEADRYDLAALLCFEVGKTWSEADGDVAEAIDFCRYYADRALVELAPKKLGSIGGEHNVLSFQGRGPAVIIAPWNFPLAILCGMSVAAYVSGNPIIMKPAEQSMATAYGLYQRMIKASFMVNALQFLPGIGEEIGSYLVKHPHTATICFTGSKTVGHQITQAANTVSPHQVQMKRVICEMGGKNAIIVDDDADLDEAISGIINSAFMYAGQKCSAASRVITVGTIHDHLIERLKDAAQSINPSAAHEPFTLMGPVIDQEAFERLNQAIERLSHDPSVKVLYKGEGIKGGYYVPIMMVEVTAPEHWVMTEELFGPILAVFKANNLEDAIKVANLTKYALTGAIFSRSPHNIAYAREHFLVGNLYINQKCTGAKVYRQPFGGFNMSGTGIKAGGPHYLLQLVDAKVVSENTMRRGFTPEISV
jgi:RHH-type transcriptional regulator, proline utilization regulon repressor / proline dehydrogenase / delta 1-pyrroline-5-carboxylate dehydrogenase